MSQSVLDKYASGQNTYGEEFEQEVISIAKHKLGHYKTYKVTDTSKTKDDIEQGTDFIVNDIRIDATLNFDEKDNMPYIHKTDILAYRGHPFYTGIRTGNNHKGQYNEFKEPVIVIGCNVSAAEYRQWAYVISDSIQDNIQELIDIAADDLYDFETTDPEDRPDISYLKPNPRYQAPKIPKNLKTNNNYAIIRQVMTQAELYNRNASPEYSL